MNQEFPEHEDQFEHLDADAVCEQCGTVNPEDTLLCKACGNNLRDQRARRISGADALLVGSGVSRVRVFTGVITTVGIMVILLAAYSVQNIESWLTDIQMTSGASAELWSGADGDLLDRLQEDLTSRPSTARERARALERPIVDTSFNGRYAIATRTSTGKNQIIGEANLARRGQKVYFVADLRVGTVEIRGFGVLNEDGDGLVADRTVGIRSEDVEDIGFGFSEMLPHGGHVCVGQSTVSSAPVQVWAFRIR